jgi:hypothetical protein
MAKPCSRHVRASSERRLQAALHRDELEAEQKLIRKALAESAARAANVVGTAAGACDVLPDRAQIGHNQRKKMQRVTLEANQPSASKTLTVSDLQRKVVGVGDGN